MSFSKTKMEADLVRLQKLNLYLKKVEELEDLTERIAWLYAQYDYLRNSRKRLVFAYWEIINGFKDWRTDDLSKCTPAESITRIARYIQNDLHLWQPDEEEKENRNTAEAAVKSFIVNTK